MARVSAIGWEYEAKWKVRQAYLVTERYLLARGQPKEPAHPIILV